MRKLILYWLLPLLVVDQALKFYIKLKYQLYESDILIPGVLDIRFVENNGMAFGMEFCNHSELFRVIAAVAIAIA